MISNTNSFVTRLHNGRRAIFMNAFSQRRQGYKFHFRLICETFDLVWTRGIAANGRQRRWVSRRGRRRLHICLASLSQSDRTMPYLAASSCIVLTRHVSLGLKLSAFDQRMSIQSHLGLKSDAWTSFLTGTWHLPYRKDKV